MNKFIKRSVIKIFAISWVVFIYLIFNYKQIINDNKEISKNFEFIKHKIQEPEINYEKKKIREVHPSLKRIAGWISSVGASASVADADGDGLPNDLCLVDPRIDKVFITPILDNRYKPFILEKDNIKINETMAPTGCLFGDFNEDSLSDVLVYYWGRTPVIFYQIEKNARQKRLDGEFNNNNFIAVELFPGGERWFTDSATSADFDGDGHLDLIICNYFQDGANILDKNGTGKELMHDSKSHSYSGGKKHFFIYKDKKNNITQYEKIENSLPKDITHGWTLAVGAADLNKDMLPEIYLSQDFGPDRLLLNKSTPGNLKFVEVKARRDRSEPKSFNLGYDSFKGMGADFADINNDGFLDIFVTNITSEWALQESNFLWINTGEISEFELGYAPFTQESEKYGVSRSGWGWDAKMVDFNNDSLKEIIVSTGFLKGEKWGWAKLQSLATGNDRMLSNPENWPAFKEGDDLSGHEKNSFFARNSTSEKFINISSEIGMGEEYVTRGIATADFDGDSKQDIVFANQWEESVIFQNKCNNSLNSIVLNIRLNGEGERIKVLEGYPLKNRINNSTPAIGAKVELIVENEKFVSFVDGGNGHAASRSPEVHFGIKDKKGKLKVIIEWRSHSGRIYKNETTVITGWNTILLGG